MATLDSMVAILLPLGYLIYFQVVVICELWFQSSPALEGRALKRRDAAYRAADQVSILARP
jgi:hypothetical protein